MSRNDALDRRTFLRQSLGLMGGSAVAVPLHALLARHAAAEEAAVAAPRYADGYGELAEVLDETTGLPLLHLPKGFRYRTFGWRGDVMSDGVKTPSLHDGMAVVAARDNHVVLIRNHEVPHDGEPFGPAELQYDQRGPGGTTSLIFDTSKGELVRSYASLGGTTKNCAGGPTPWGTWLTCEEAVDAPGDVIGNNDNRRELTLEKAHGYIFEVPARGKARPEPLKDMGRFVHEAVAVDPKTGIVYETEDREPAGFYRFLPKVKGNLSAGGRLQMMKVEGRDDLTKGVTIGDQFHVSWIDIPDPDLAHSPGTRDEHGVFHQGKAEGGATFIRLEGCWYGNGEIYFVSTSGGDAGYGQVWAHRPADNMLRLIFESPGKEMLDYPDNLTVSPRGGLVLCEDGGRQGQLVLGLSVSGELFPLVRNNVVLDGERNDIRGDFRKKEWAGATFSPDGKWLFANIQTPGLTVAITGPWSDHIL